MVYDAARGHFGQTFDQTNQFETLEEQPNTEAQRFYDLLNEYNQSLYIGHEIHFALSVFVRIMSIKCDWNVAHDAVDEFLKLMGETTPKEHNVPRNYYEARKLVSQLGLISKKIDCCINGCMLYYKDDIENSKCKFCRSPHYKPGRGNRKQVPMKRMHYLSLIP